MNRQNCTPERPIGLGYALLALVATVVVVTLLLLRACGVLA